MFLENIMPQCPHAVVAPGVTPTGGNISQQGG